MGGGDRREAQDPPFPGGIGEQLPGIEPSHAMPDQVDRLIAERPLDLLAKPLGPTLHAGDRRDARDHHAVSPPRGASWESLGNNSSA